MPKISACIISFNEEDKIEDCIRSLLPVADEIVAIASRYKNCIFHQQSLGHIEQKNLAIDRAENDWILSLDCDERLSETLQQSILEIKVRLDEATAWCMARRALYVYCWLNHCWYPDIKTRLFYRGTLRWSSPNPHDHIQTIVHITEIGADELPRGKRQFNLFSPVTHSTWILIKLYFTKRGFLDGFAGLLVSVLSATHVFVKYAKALVKRRQAQKAHRREGDA